MPRSAPADDRRQDRHRHETGTADKWKGQVYTVEDGKTYSGSITLVNATTLNLQGCALGGLICKTQTWTRTN